MSRTLCHLRLAAIIAAAMPAAKAGAAEEFVRARAGTNADAARMANEAVAQIRAGNDLDGARRKLDAAIQLDPTFWPAFFTRAQVNFEQKRWAAAAEDATAALRGRPWFAASALIRAVANARLGKYGASAAELEHIISLQPKGTTYPSALNHLAWLRATCPDASIRDGAQAITYAKRACALTAWKRGAPIDTLAVSYAEAGDFESAIRYAEQAIRAGDLSPATMSDVQHHLASFRGRQPIRMK